MLTKVFKVFKVFLKSKFIFKNPDNKKLIIFDDVIFNELRLILEKKKYFLLKNRYENINNIYITLKVILNFIKFFKGNINTAYLASIINLVNPKVVLTFHDNSPKFHDLAKIFHKKISFIAIQQAARYDVIWKNYDYKKGLTKNLNKNFFLPIFLTFGLYEKKLYKNFNIDVKKYYTVGSLKLANFLEFLKQKKKHKVKKKYDVCLVSDLPPGIDKAKFLKYEVKKIKDTVVDMTKNTILFCKKNNKKFIFSTKMKSGKELKNEMNFYRQNLSNEDYSFLLRNSFKCKIRDAKSKYFNKDFSSYIAIFQSDVVIGNITSMLKEKVSLGGKILACNFTNLDIFDFPVKKFLLLKNGSYEEFEKRLSLILKMKDKIFYEKLGVKKNFIIESSNETNTIKKINQIINSKI